MSEKTGKLFHFRPLFYGFLALLISIFSTKFVFSGDLTYIIVVALLFVCTTIFLCLRKQFFIMIFLACVVGIGVGGYYLALLGFSTEQYSSVCNITGRVTDYNSGSQFILDDVKINGKKEKNIYISIIFTEKQISTGDIINFDAEVEQAHLFELGDLQSFYFRHNIGYKTSVNESQISKSGSKVKFDEKVRNSVKQTLVTFMGNKNGNVAYSVLFGDKTQIEDEVKEVYNGAGIMHLLSVSGLHVGFLIALLGFVLKKCRVNKFANFVINMILLGFYAYLCGFSPSVVRAGIMGLVLLFANLSGKWYDNLNCMGLAGIIILLISPLSAFDVGFLMSFGCVFSIFLLYPLCSSLFEKIFPSKIAKAISVSVSAQLGVLPFSAMIFSSFNFLAFFVNLIIVPIFSILFPILFIGVLFASLTGIFGFLLKFCGFGFDVIYFVADKFSETGLSVSLNPTKIYVVIAFFILMFVLSRYFIVSNRRRVVCGVSMFATLLVCFGLSFIPQTAKKSVSFFNSFGAYSILVTNSAKESVIIDLGTANDMKKFTDVLGAKNVSSVFMLESSKVKYDSFNDIGAKHIVRCENLQGYDEEILVTENAVSKVGNFEFCYRSNSGKVFGLEIQFDDTKLFIFKSKLVTEENVEYVAGQNYDFVVFNGVAGDTLHFGEKTTIVAQYQTYGVDASASRDGNFSYIINSTGNYRRCLD